MRTTLSTVFVLLMVAGGCATTFKGSAHVEGGPTACTAKCQALGEEFLGMVVMGEYSDACVCRVPGKATAENDATAVAGAVSGVVTQMRSQEAEAQHAP